jgi:hypothetical protein
MNPTPKKSTDELVQYYHSILSLNNPKVRVPMAVAKQFLWDNQSKILNGTVHHFCIRNIGLGICSVELNDKSVKETKMGK